MRFSHFSTLMGKQAVTNKSSTLQAICDVVKLTASLSRETSVFRGTGKCLSCSSLHSIAVTRSTRHVSLEIARGTCLEVERGAAGFDLSSSGLCETRLGVWVSWVRYCHFSWPSVQPGRYTIRWEGGLDRVVWGVIGFRRKTMEGGNLNRQSDSEWFSL